MALDTYANLSTALGSWEERTFTSGETDEFILLAEANANLKLANDFRRRKTATVNTDASGYGTLPTGFVGLTSVVRDVLGSVPLKQVPWDALVTRNPYEVGDDAQVFSLRGTSFRISPVADDDFLFEFSGSVPALTGVNTTNWLLTIAPQYYLFYGRAMAAAKFDDPRMGPFIGQANQTLEEIVSQGNVAEYGRAEMTLPMVTP